MKSDKLIECVPNFSEGRDASTIEAIRTAILSVPGCELWDYSSDYDHNRSVFTLAGTPEALESAVMEFTKTAIERIDMTKHEGAHPCIGAVDVIPFIPLQNTTMEECVLLSEKIGKRIATEFELPVYLYARSAKKTSHTRLADIRRGGYFGLCEEIAASPDRTPDFGPLRLNSAGAVSIGARDFLIAFNIYLNTAELSIARNIAKTIRESSGGLPGVQAIGLKVNGCAQVSMNLLDYRKTSLKTIVQAVSKEAKACSVSILYSELIGLLPREALENSTPKELFLKEFSKDKIIETYLS